MHEHPRGSGGDLCHSHPDALAEYLPRIEKNSYDDGASGASTTPA